MKKLLRLALRLSFLSLFVFPASSLSVYSQNVGTCQEGKANAYLDALLVRARILNTGGLFWNGDSNVYEVPKDSGNMAIFSSSLVVGGYVGDELRMSAARYGLWEMWPGPLDENGNAPAHCSVYDRLYKVSRSDLEELDKTGFTSNQDVYDWPAELGAPVKDGDGVLGNYDILKGDRPKVTGDQMIWWVMNDMGNAHRATGSPPVGLEVQAKAFVSSFFPYTSFYQYQMIYKAQESIDRVYSGFFVDPDLGDAGDDFIGSDSLLHMAYVYNADNYDGAYGANPPALGFVLGASSKQEDAESKLSSFMHYLNGGGVLQDPGTGLSYYYNSSCRFSNGNSFRVGGDGTSGKVPTCFIFPGDPVTGEGWSEENADGTGQANAGGDRRFLFSTGPHSLVPGDTLHFQFAIVFARGDHRLDSVTKLKQKAFVVRQLMPSLLKGPPYPWSPEDPPIIPYDTTKPVIDGSPVIGSVFPNPAGDDVVVHFGIQEDSDVSFSVYDVLGREVDSSPPTFFPKGENYHRFSTAALPTGFYVVRLSSWRGTSHHRFVVKR